MRVEPRGAELLRVARAELLDALLPTIPESHRYAARMVANAMAIAARELEAPPGREGDLATLAGEIRAGVHDGAKEVEETLRAITRDRLAVSNPRVLEGYAR